MTAAPTPRPDPHPGLAGLLLTLAVGVLVGALAGGAIGGYLAVAPQATALVELVAPPDPAVTAAAGTAASTTEEAAAAAANELAAINGEAFNQEVAQRVGDADAPRVEVTRVGQSTIAEFTARGSSEQESVRVVQAAVDLYLENRTEAQRALLDAAAASVDKTLGELESQVSRPEPRQRAAPVDPTLQGRIDRVRLLRSDIQIALNREGTPVRVVQPVTPTRTDATPWLLGAVLGGLSGGFVGVGARVLRRSRSTAVVDRPTAEAATGGTVLHPEVRLAQNWEVSGLRVSREADRYASRILAAQVADSRPLLGRTIAVVAASRESGSSVVATLLAHGAAKLAPTILAEVTTRNHPLMSTDRDGAFTTFGDSSVEGLTIARVDEAPGPGRAGDGTWARLVDSVRSGRRCVVIDVGTNPELVAQLPGPVDAVVVMARGVDDSRHVAALAKGVLRFDQSVSGVLTRPHWRRRLRRRTADG